MIDVKQAVRIAKINSTEILGMDGSLEEIERETYNGKDAWSITLGIARDLEHLPAIARLSANPLQYKVFLIDAETGDLLAVKLHQLTSR